MSAFSVLAQPRGTQMLGAVAQVSDDTVTLTDGSTFGVTEQTRITQIWPGSVADLVPGRFVAISAARGPDGVLVASLVGAFPENVRAGEGQLEMTEISFCQPGCQPRDLMTNASITEARVDAISGGEMTISFLDQTSQVAITPDTRVELQAAGSMDDIVPGANVIGFVNPEGVAGSIWVYEP
jgi:hypothetical protein